MTDDVQNLSAVLDKTAALIETTTPEQRTAATPCSEWDVQRLLAHLVGWSGNFAARAEGRKPDDDPDSVDPGSDAARIFRENAGAVVAALSSGRELPEHAPAPAILIAEYILHGWDLATATGQPIAYTDQEAEPGLEAMKDMLKPEYRGHGFEAEVEVPPESSTVERLLAFSGRDPAASDQPRAKTPDGNARAAATR